jgi:hypothetical protein
VIKNLGIKVGINLIDLIALMNRLFVLMVKSGQAKSMSLAAAWAIAAEAAKLLLARCESWHMNEIIAFAVICRVIVMLV